MFKILVSSIRVLKHIFFISGLTWSEISGGEVGLRVFGAIICSMLVTTTIVGNVLVLVVVTKFRRLRSITNLLLASLATADITVASLVMPFSIIYDLDRQWRFGPIACHLWISCDVMCCTASILHLCVIALDRFWAITKPFRYRSLVSRKRIGFVIAFVWMCSAAISFIPIFLGWYSDHPVSIFQPSTQCSLSVNHIYATISSLTSFYLPLPIMFYVYFRILMVAEHQAREIKQLEKSLQGIGAHGMRRSLRRRSKQVVTDTKAIRTLGIVMGVFCVCWLPFFLMYVILAYCSNCYLSYEIRSAITWLGYFNSSFNPCIYAFLNRDFKEAFKIVLCCRHHNGSNIDETSTGGGKNLRMDRLNVEAITPEARTPCLSPQVDHVSWPSGEVVYDQYQQSSTLLTVPGAKNHVNEHFL